MTSCHTVDSLITPFIDGELAEADHRAVEDHLRRCAPCHAREAAERAVRGLILARRSSLAAPAPAPLRDACAKIARDVASHQSSVTSRDVGSRSHRPTLSDSRLMTDDSRLMTDDSRLTTDESRLTTDDSRLTTDDSRLTTDDSRLTTNDSRLTTDDRRLPTARPATWRQRLAPYALAASLVVVVGGAFLYQATNKSARLLAAELTADHLKCFAMNRALGTHQDVAAVESSLVSAFGWRAHLPEDPARAGLELVGSRPCLYAQGKIAHIMYKHRGTPVSLFMLPNTARTKELVEVLGHEAAIWCVGNRTFVLLSRQSKLEVEQLASFVQAGLH